MWLQIQTKREGGSAGGTGKEEKERKQMTPLQKAVKKK